MQAEHAGRAAHEWTNDEAACGAQGLVFVLAAGAHGELTTNSVLPEAGGVGQNQRTLRIRGALRPLHLLSWPLAQLHLLAPPNPQFPPHHMPRVPVLSVLACC